MAHEEATELGAILEEDKGSVEELKRDIRTQTQHAESGSRALEYLGTYPGAYSLGATSGFPSQYFCDLLNSFEERMAQYKKQISQIDEYLGTSHADAAHDPQKLKEIMLSHYDYFMGNAASTAALHEEIVQLKQQLLGLLKQMGIKEDPFKSAKLNSRKKSVKSGKLALPPPVQVIKAPDPKKKQDADGFGGTDSGSSGGWGGTTDSGWGDTSSTFGGDSSW
ncbi:MAG: hypothetical protein Q8P67_15760 [archaeon]|nr:hypothetical protein [archaeon]